MFLLLSGCQASSTEGVIEEISGNVLTIAPAEQDPEEQYVLITISFNEQTRLTGAASDLTDLRVGDQIKVSLNQQIEEAFAEEIRVVNE